MQVIEQITELVQGYRLETCVLLDQEFQTLNPARMRRKTAISSLKKSTPSPTEEEYDSIYNAIYELYEKECEPIKLKTIEKIKSLDSKFSSLAQDYGLRMFFEFPKVIVNFYKKFTWVYFSSPHSDLSDDDEPKEILTPFQEYNTAMRIRTSEYSDAIQCAQTWYKAEKKRTRDKCDEEYNIMKARVDQIEKDRDHFINLECEKKKPGDYVALGEAVSNIRKKALKEISEVYKKFEQHEIIRDQRIEELVRLFKKEYEPGLYRKFQKENLENRIRLEDKIAATGGPCYTFDNWENAVEIPGNLGTKIL